MRLKYGHWAKIKENKGGEVVTFVVLQDGGQLQITNLGQPDALIWPPCLGSPSTEVILAGHVWCLGEEGPAVLKFVGLDRQLRRFEFEPAAGFSVESSGKIEDEKPEPDEALAEESGGE